MDKKKILFVGNTSWGMYNFRLDLMRTLKKKGYEIIILSPEDEYSEKLKKEFHYENYYLNNKSLNPFKDIRTILNLYYKYKKLKPDFIFQYTIKPNIYGSFVAKINKIKSISVITGLGTSFIKNNRLSKFINFLYRISLKNNESIWFLNNEDREFFVSKNIVKKEKTFILNGEGIDSEKFCPSDNGNNEKNKFIFLLIARLIWDKGIKEYVDSAKIIKNKHDNVEFDIVGNYYFNNPNAITKSQIEEWENSGIIKYLGYYDDIREIISNSNCIVLPSYREGLSRVLLEAASMGKPIIATNVPGCKEIVINNYNGYLVKVKNYIDLSENMEKILNLSEEEIKIMGENSRDIVIKKFDQKIINQEYISFLEKIIK